MRNEIQKILEMQSSGKISQDQATELLIALHEQTAQQMAEGTSNTNEPKASVQPGPRTESIEDRFEKRVETNVEHLLEGVGGLIEKVVHSALSDGLSGLNVKINGRGSKVTASDDNRFVASKIEVPIAACDFSDNHFNLSTATHLDFDAQSEFTDNRVQASTLTGLTLRQGTMTDTSINGSSLDQVVLDDSLINDTKINGSKVVGLELHNDSEWNDTTLNGCNFKEVQLHHSQFQDLSLHGTTLSKTTFENVEFSDLALKAVQMSDCKWSNCEIDDAAISNCTFKNCEIRNVEWSDFSLANVDFSDQVLDGTEAFKAFIHKSR